MRTIIAGGRDLNSEFLVDTVMEANHCHPDNGWPVNITEVVSGGARGADALGERWAAIHDIPVKVFEAAWDTYGKSAGARRNVEMADYADALIAFWDGQSKGTKHMIDTALAKGLDVHVYRYE